MDSLLFCRHLKLQKLREVSVSDDACTLCFDAVAVVRILPCAHEGESDQICHQIPYKFSQTKTFYNLSSSVSGFCDSCAHMLDNCALCRGPIEKIEKIKDQSKDGS